MRIALYQPDIPQNAGAVFRLAGCLGLPVDVIEPCGFQMTEKSLRRVGMDNIFLIAPTTPASTVDTAASPSDGTA